MTVIYQTTITRIGASAAMALEEQMLITFREGAPADIEEYCFIHNHGELPARCSRAQSCSLASCATR
jgi:PTS system glucitol/sorbitol-specific IIA component